MSYSTSPDEILHTTSTFLDFLEVLVHNPAISRWSYDLRESLDTVLIELTCLIRRIRLRLSVTFTNNEDYDTWGSQAQFDDL